MISYNPLWKTLIDRDLKKMDLVRPPISLATSTLAKLGKNEYVALSVLEKICLTLNCKIEDVVEVRME